MPEGRNLLLTGPPGVGKTTVLAEVARRLGGRKLGGFLTEEIRPSGGQACCCSLCLAKNLTPRLGLHQVCLLHRIAQEFSAVLRPIVLLLAPPFPGAPPYRLSFLCRLQHTLILPRNCPIHYLVDGLIGAGR